MSCAPTDISYFPSMFRAFHSCLRVPFNHCWVSQCLSLASKPGSSVIRVFVLSYATISSKRYRINCGPFLSITERIEGTKVEKHNRLLKNVPYCVWSATIEAKEIHRSSRSNVCDVGRENGIRLAGECRMRGGHGRLVVNPRSRSVPRGHCSNSSNRAIQLPQG